MEVSTCLDIDIIVFLTIIYLFTKGELILNEKMVLEH